VYEAGATVVRAIPHAHTEITEYAAKYKKSTRNGRRREVAMEVAMGASVGGARVMTAMSMWA
jgi:TPP-dependent indolepyruvate ferredoxin oxidoreductase alpha subunit